MKTFTLNLEDEMFTKIAAIAKQAGIAEQDIEGWFAQQVFAPLKMSLDMGSSGFPHLYCRLKPRYYGDTAPAHMAERILPSHEYAKYVSELRTALAE